MHLNSEVLCYIILCVCLFRFDGLLLNGNFCLGYFGFFHFFFVMFWYKHCFLFIRILSFESAYSATFHQFMGSFVFVIWKMGLYSYSSSSSWHFRSIWLRWMWCWSYKSFHLQSEWVSLCLGVLYTYEEIHFYSCNFVIFVVGVRWVCGGFESKLRERKAKCSFCSMLAIFWKEHCFLFLEGLAILVGVPFSSNNQ